MQFSVCQEVKNFNDVIYYYFFGEIVFFGEKRIRDLLLWYNVKNNGPTHNGFSIFLFIFLNQVMWRIE